MLKSRAKSTDSVASHSRGSTICSELELESIQENVNVLQEIYSFGGMDDKTKKCCGKCCYCFKLCIRSTPYRTTVGRVGSKRNKIRNTIHSTLLAVCLIIIAITFGQQSMINFVNFEKRGNGCMPSQQSTVYMNKYRNITNYYVLSPIGPLAKNITTTLYKQALDQYNYHEGVQGIQNGTKWPRPYQATDEMKLIQKARRATSNISKAVDEACGYSGYQCLLRSDRSVRINYTQISQQTSESMNAYLLEIFERINYISSFYCFYMAAMIFIGAPYVITSRKLFPDKIQFALSTLGQPLFIVIILLLWYSSEISQFVWSFFVVQVDVLRLIQFSFKEPCFSNSDFLQEIFSGGAQICKDIEMSYYLYVTAVDDLKYYASVEETYNGYYWASDQYKLLHPHVDIRYSEFDKIFTSNDLLSVDYDLLSEKYDLTWDDSNATECSIDTMLDYIGPSDSSKGDIWSYLLFSGAFAALLIPPVLANLTITLFKMIDPLSPYCGRVEIPYKRSDVETAGDSDEFKEYKDKDLLKDIRKFERAKNCPLLIIWCTILILIMLNMAANKIKMEF